MKNLVFCTLGLLFTLNCLSQTSNEKNVLKEFMYFVYSDGNRVTDLSSKKQQLHIQKIGDYIQNLAETGKLKDAQPLEMDGILIGSKKGVFNEVALNKNKKVISGYYHILAKNMKEAVAIAKADPRFEEDGWEIMIRPIKKVKGIN